MFLEKQRKEGKSKASYMMRQGLQRGQNCRLQM
jgi:hypothetical protein